jgi:hypothetical protein
MYLTDAARNELERICGDGNGTQTREGFCGPQERANLDMLESQWALPLADNPDPAVANVPPRTGRRHRNDPIDKIIFGTGYRKKVATATYDPGFPQYLQTFGIEVDYIDLTINGAIPPRLGGL